MCDIWTLPNGLYDEHDIWPILEKNVFPYLTNMDPLGGEPFVQKDTFRLIKLMSELNPTCKWSFTTNAHWNFNESIKKHLNLLPHVDIRISLDGLTDETYKKIRGGELALVLDCIDKMVLYNEERKANHMRPMNLALAMTVQTYNWKEMHLFADYGNKDIFHEFHFQETVGDEDYQGEEILILKKLSHSERKRICDYILNSLAPRALFKAKEILYPILETFEVKEKVILQKEFYQKSIMKF